MPRKVLPRMLTVSAASKPLSLQIRWDTGDDTSVDVSGPIDAFHVYAPLRDDPVLFRKVRVGEYGADIVWTDDLDMSYDTL